MGILDSLKGGAANKESESLRAELNLLKKQFKTLEAELSLSQNKHVELIDKTHAFMERLKVLVGTLDGEAVLARCWDLLDLSLGIKKGAVFQKIDEGWLSELSIGFKDDEIPLVPNKEDSMFGYAAEQGLIMSLAFVRKQDDLAYLERRGVIPDAKIVCPVRIGQNFEKMIVICSYSGNVFSGEDDLDTVQMVATILGLVLQNTRVLSLQKQELDQKKQELFRLRSMFSSMVAPEVIDFIEKNPDGIVLGGKRQKVAVLFADIRNFTEMASDISPEKTIELLNQFFSLVTDIVIQTRGTLDKFMGDAAMALYGTPVPIEDPVKSAVNAAMEIQHAIAQMMPKWKSEGLPNYGIGIGINFQDVVVGNVGSARLSNFTAIGDGVNIASRLCAIANAGEILISESCFEKLDWKGHFEKKTGLVIKGKAEPITAYAISSSPTTSAAETCPSCSAPLPASARFCGSCGYRRQ